MRATVLQLVTGDPRRSPSRVALLALVTALAIGCNKPEALRVTSDGSVAPDLAVRIDVAVDPSGDDELDAAGGSDTPDVATAPDVDDPARPGLVEGAACSADAQCRSQFCVDGVCCDVACTGTCLSCAVQGSVGACVPADVGTDPRDQCPDEGSASCGRDGVCDGAGACRKYPPGAMCRETSCTGSTMTLVGRCDGLGSCAASGSQTCAPFNCDVNATCRTSCTSDAQCSAPNTCVDGSCGKKPLGSACSEATQCNSGFCEQGICCGGPCSGACRSCALSGTAGTCTTVPAGDDPLGQCADTGAAMCGRDGACDGNGACRLYAAGTVCGTATCSGATELGTRRCDGTGACATAASRSCAPFACGAGGTCSVACATSDQCTTGFFCIDGTCTKKAVGATCAAATDCVSGMCQQGVCCNRACTAACESCAVAGAEGTCSPVPAGQKEPLDRCVTTPAQTCGTDGFCDGKGGCRLFTSGTICRGLECTGSTQSLASRCDGLGSCVAGGTQSCAPYGCGTDAICKTTCAASADCSAGNVCSGTSCGKKSVGTTCSAAADCDSGFCEQGICCGSACAGTCQSCALPGSAGSCSAVPAGQDPVNHCPDDGASSCSRDGTCDGAGACRLYPAGSVCAAPTCLATTYTSERTCNGAGSCRAAATSTCDNYACDTNGTCRRSCATDAHCSSGYVCNAGVCSKKLPGVDCAAGSDCQSGFCQQGVCCASSCTGSCRSCAVAGSLGTCALVPAGQDPLSHCPDDGVATCDRDGMCDGAGSCRLYASGVACGGASCTGGFAFPAPRCNGSGTCETGTSTACSPYQCGTNACETTCSNNMQCQSPATCVVVNGVGTCSSKSNGSTCSAGSECASGSCAQGRCCATACSGGCRSCALAGSEGTCTVIPAGQLPQSPTTFCADAGGASCGTDGFCDGSGGCRFYAAGTTCAAASCSGATFTAARTCSGGGSCQAVPSVSCGKYTCDGAVCRTNCASNADCTGRSICQSSFCGGLRAEYYDNVDFTNLRLTRTDAVVNFDWGFGSPDASIGADYFSVRWTGTVTPQTTETHTFHTYSDDTVQLWIDNVLVISNTTPHGVTKNSSAGIALSANRSYSIVMQVTEREMHAVAKLLWSAPSFSERVIGVNRFTPPP